MWKKNMDEEGPHSGQGTAVGIHIVMALMSRADVPGRTEAVLSGET